MVLATTLREDGAPDDGEFNPQTQDHQGPTALSMSCMAKSTE